MAAAVHVFLHLTVLISSEFIDRPGRRLDTSRGQIARNLHPLLDLLETTPFSIVSSFNLCFCLGTSGHLQITLPEYLSESSCAHFVT